MGRRRATAAYDERAALGCDVHKPDHRQIIENSAPILNLNRTGRLQEPHSAGNYMAQRGWFRRPEDGDEVGFLDNEDSAGTKGGHHAG
jgi:hypothetical protein